MKKTFLVSLLQLRSSDVIGKVSKVQRHVEAFVSEVLRKAVSVLKKSDSQSIKEFCKCSSKLLFYYLLGLWIVSLS